MAVFLILVTEPGCAHTVVSANLTTDAATGHRSCNRCQPSTEQVSSNREFVATTYSQFTPAKAQKVIPYRKENLRGLPGLRGRLTGCDSTTCSTSVTSPGGTVAPLPAGWQAKQSYELLTTLAFQLL